MGMTLLDVNWMARGNLTVIVLNDALTRLASITGERRLYVEKTYWRVVASLEERYDIELYLTGQVFAGPSADVDTLLGDKEFWEDLVQDSLRLTQELLERQ